MKTKPDQPSGSLELLKAFGTGLGCALFFVASATVAWYARHSQISGQPMANSKGGFMTSRDGYCIALVLFLLAIAAFFFARPFWCCKKVKGPEK